MEVYIEKHNLLVGSRNNLFTIIMFVRVLVGFFLNDKLFFW